MTNDDDPVVELARRAAAILGAADLIGRHPVTGRVQKISFDAPKIEDLPGGARSLIITFRDTHRPDVTFGYRMSLPPGWEKESPPGLVAGLVTSEIIATIEAATAGLPLETEPGEICWIEEP